GDLICVSGTVGDAAFGLKHLGHDLQKRLDYPTPRCALGAALKGLANSMIDVSDGLAQDLGHILKASDVGAKLQLENLPLSTALHALNDEQKWQYALAGGDDYEFGDLICVSGTVGDAAFGLKHLGHDLQKRLDYPT
ncbi:hypothetical protein D9B85_13515, partial [Corynebacterium diphtheriae]